MANLNETFYRSTKARGTFSLHHGHQTETVYIFLHGLFGDGAESLKAAKEKFSEGANVIVGTLPGHEKQSLSSADNSAGVWMEYAEFLGLVARRYGKKVVFIGKSTGANLAVRAAESGHADELVLLQPLFALNPYLKAGVKTGRWVPRQLRIGKSPSCVVSHVLGRSKVSIEDVLNAADQAETLAHVDYRPIQAKVPVKIYIADKDPVVSRKAILEWAKTYAPHAKLVHHNQPWNHLYDPF